MKSYLASALFIFLIANICNSQNLVLNGSFEETEKCVSYIGGFDKVKFWSKPTWGTTDLFNKCAKSENGVPYNYNGKQEPKDGNKYIGMYCYANDNWREYIQGQLIHTLTKNKRYVLRFYISLAETSDFELNEFHVLFTESPITLTHDRELSSRFLKKYKIANYSHYDIKRDRYYSDSDRWTLMELEFIATGSESYFTIGNMNKNSKTEKQLRSSKNRQNMSYYYIDDVSLIDPKKNINDEKAYIKKRIKKSPDNNFKLNSTYTLKSVQFEFDSGILLDASKDELNKLVTYLHKNTDLKITVNGHTDYLGKAAYNQKLSEERAKSVADYLISKGISENRITSKGYGESQPIDPNEPEDAQAKNRRVEFILTQYSTEK